MFGCGGGAGSGLCSVRQGCSPRALCHLPVVALPLPEDDILGTPCIPLAGGRSGSSDSRVWSLLWGALGAYRRGPINRWLQWAGEKLFID